jgi:predicted nucleic acid-binding protein
VRCYTVDASVVAKWHFPEDLSDAASALLAQAIAGAVRLVAPEFLLCEMGSVIVKKLRANQVRRDDAEIILASLPTGPVSFVSVERLLPRALALAMTAGASFYDALYLAVGEECEGTLLTADAALINQARGNGLAHMVTSLDELGI